MKFTDVYYKNLKAYRQGHKTIANIGGSRSGKSWSILQVLNHIAELSRVHKKISLISHSFPHLREGLLYDFTRYYAKAGRDLKRYHNSSSKEIFINDSIINYFSADKGDKVHGPARDIAFLNEPNKGITFDAYNQIEARTGEALWMDWNPSGKFWATLDENQIMANAHVIHSTFRDNLENLKPKQIQTFKDNYRKSMLINPYTGKISAYWHNWWKIYGDGIEAVDLEERIMPFLRRVATVPEDAYEIPSGLDFGWHPHPTAFVRMWIRPGELISDLYIKQIVYNTRLQISATADGDDYGNLVDILNQAGISKRHQIIADSVDGRAINGLRKAGFIVEGVKKKKVELTIPAFHDYNIHIVGDSDQIYYEFDNYRYDRDKTTDQVLKVPAPDQPDHSIDAARYVLMSEGYRWAIPRKKAA